ncbi:MAG: transcriptional repressor [Actinomycetota bacterium]|nr:transcriptional repressor [Actinomycetota bacterium]
MASDLDTTVSDLLRGVDQRYTSGRRGLVNLLATAGRPLSIPEILTQDTSVPQSSVYRNLAVLEQAGVVHKVMATDEFSRFELTEELTRHHHHLVCVSCGTVDDYTVSPGLEQTMATTIDEVSAKTGFHIQAHRIDLLGRCARCG